MSESDFPWPSPEDDIFEIASGNWRATADVQDHWGSHATLYATGYRMGAERLAQHVLETGGDQDFLVYPILFLYRQYVELRLKEIATDAVRLLDREPPPGKLMKRHELEPLWAFSRTLLAEMDSGPVDDLDNAELTLKKLAWADPGSFAFRYATDKKGERSLPDDLKKIDLERVRDVMSGIGNLLDGALDMIDAHQQSKDEMQEWWG